MALNVSTAKTKRFIDYWAFAPSAIAVSLYFMCVFSWSLANTLVDKTITVEEEEAVKVDTIDIQANQIGALRIDVKSNFSNSRGDNDWIIYEIQLRDRQGEIIASAIDEDWKESGTWYEDGQRGRWSESELSGGIDLRAIEGEQVDVFIQLLERREISGVDPAPVSFAVKIQNGVVEHLPLWWGTFFSSVLALIALSATNYSGQKAIRAKIRDSDPQGRGMVGGKDNLVRVKICSKLDRNTPRSVRVKLAIDNEYGEAVYRHCYRTEVAIKREDGKVRGGSVHLTSFFVLEPYGSYRFKVDITPDASVDWTSLEVRQNSKTLKEVNVTTISNTST